MRWRTWLLIGLLVAAGLCWFATRTPPAALVVPGALGTSRDWQDPANAALFQPVDPGPEGPTLEDRRRAEEELAKEQMDATK